MHSHVQYSTSHGRVVAAYLQIALRCCRMLVGVHGYCYSSVTKFVVSRPYLFVLHRAQERTVRAHFMTTAEYSSSISTGQRSLLEVKRRYTLGLLARTRALVQRYTNRALRTAPTALRPTSGYHSGALSGDWACCITESDLRVWVQLSPSGDFHFLEAHLLETGGWSFRHRGGDTGLNFPE